jgi:hypothetical protein
VKAAGPTGARVDLAEALRRAQDAVAGARPPDDVATEVARLLDAASVRLAGATLPGSREHPVIEEQALVPVFAVTQTEQGLVRGTVRFRRFHLGGGAAVHGGVLPLLFDDVLGRLSTSLGGPLSRTAYLRVDFRNITPIDVDLAIEAVVARVEGRKRFLNGVLSHEGTVLAEAEGLWVELRPGQP